MGTLAVGTGIVVNAALNGFEENTETNPACGEIFLNQSTAIITCTNPNGSEIQEKIEATSETKAATCGGNFIQQYKYINPNSECSGRIEHHTERSRR